MLYIVKMLADGVCLQYDNKRKASLVFDAITDRGQDAVLYSFYDGSLVELQRIAHPKKSIGCMQDDREMSVIDFPITYEQ